MLDQPQVEQIVQKAAATATVTVPGGSILFGFSLGEWHLFFAFLFPLLTLIVYTYFKLKEDRRKDEIARRVIARNDE